MISASIIIESIPAVTVAAAAIGAIRNASSVSAAVTAAVPVTAAEIGLSLTIAAVAVPVPAPQKSILAARSDLQGILELRTVEKVV